MKLIAIIAMSLLFVSSAFAVKWTFHNPDGHMSPLTLINADQNGPINMIWIWKTSDERVPWAITIRFERAEEHDQFRDNMREYFEHWHVNQPDNNPRDLTINVDHLTAELPRTPARWIHILTAIHAIDTLTPDVLAALENLLGFGLPREVFTETQVPDDQAEVAAVDPETEPEFVMVNPVQPQNTTTVTPAPTGFLRLVLRLNPFGAGASQ